jgi:hypothetical protein
MRRAAADTASAAGWPRRAVHGNCPIKPQEHTMNAGSSVQSAKIESLIGSVRETLETSIESIRSVNTDLKVLSINAKIQAARAGTAGAGFSIVADEMNKLSGKTQRIIGDMQEDVSGALEALSNMEHETRGQRLSQIAANCIDLVDRNLYERSCDVRWWATDSALADALAALGDPRDGEKKLAYAADRMAVILEAYTVYFDLLLCDTAGNIVCNGRPGIYKCTGAYVGGSGWFTEARTSASGGEYGFEGPITTVPAHPRNALVYSCGVRTGGGFWGCWERFLTGTGSEERC